MTDHRIGLTLYLLDRIIQGDLAEIVDALVAHDQAERLAAQEPTRMDQSGTAAEVLARESRGWRRRSARSLRRCAPAARAMRLTCRAGCIIWRRVSQIRCHAGPARHPLSTRRGACAAPAGQPDHRPPRLLEVNSRVTRDTLDPRPETETLVEVALAEPFARS